MILKKGIIVLLIIALTALILIAFTKIQRNNLESKNFKIALQSAPTGFDPQNVQTTYDLMVDENMFIGLVSPNPRSLDIEKDLAIGWEITNDGKIYTFYLRNDAYWSDGKKITAEDVRKSYLRLIAPNSKSQYAGMVRQIIRNGEDFGANKVNENSVGLKAIDDLTLEITLSKPSPYFLEIITQAIFFPIPMHVVEKYGDSWTDPKHIVVSGPCKLKNNDKDGIVFTKNPKYYNGHNVKVGKLTFIVEPDSDRALNMFNNEELDFQKISNNIKNKNAIYSHGVNRIVAYAFNTKVKPLDNNKVRAALNLSIDREKLVYKILKSRVIPTRRMSPT